MIKRKYVKWILGLDRRTPNYILVEETKMIELRLEAIRRAIMYEERARKYEKNNSRMYKKRERKNGGRRE